MILTCGGAGSRKTGTTRASQFKFNGVIVKNICDVTAKISPNAILLIVTNPVNSLVPMVSEMYKKVCAELKKLKFKILLLHQYHIV